VEGYNGASNNPKQEGNRNLSRNPRSFEKQAGSVMPRGPKGEKHLADVIGNAVTEILPLLSFGLPITVECDDF
jgi:hypothetical protein